MNLLLRNSLALVAAFAAGAGCTALLLEARGPATSAAVTSSTTTPGVTSTTMPVPLRLGVDDARTHLVIQLPTAPPVSMMYDAAHTEKLLDQLGALRVYLTPPRPNTGLATGDNLVVLPDSSWYVGPDKRADKVVFALMDARYGWVATEFDRERATRLVAALRQYLPGLGI